MKTDNLTIPADIYKAVLHVTDKDTRHLAVENGSLAKARASQRKHASFIKRLCALLLKKNPGHTMTIGYTLGPKVSDRVDVYGRFKLLATVWLIKDSKIVRSAVVMHAYDTSCLVFVEHTLWPHPGCSWQDGVDSVIEVASKSRAVTAANLIQKTPYSSYAALEKPVIIESYP